MAVPRLCLKLLLVLELGLVHSRTLPTNEPCKKDLQHTTSILTCINLSTLEDVQVLKQLLNSSSQAVLRFQDSDIGLLPKDVFEGHQVTSLYVIACGLREVPHLLVSPICGQSLQTLWVTKNQIAAVPGGGFRGCSKIRTLDLSANGIRTVSRMAFQGLESLQELNLQFNAIRVFAGFEGLGALKTLLLTKNGMAVVNSDALRGMDRLETLDLGYNKLSTLETGTLQPMAIKDTTIWNPRRYLYLEGNPWNCTCSLQWLQEWLLDNGFPKNDPECAWPVQGPLMTLDLCPVVHYDAPSGHISALIPKTGLILLSSIVCASSILGVLR